ncbi:heat shock 70 kDa protein 16-like [Dorcoceras hygrometricum]|uniref:Heat shock 70 kDa protein 16-like n=1 Tax=Dorcoceras hygrometricum TaxID=472368 RepID=A0A2Z7C0A9_9LAMI|nr:heat shock 70 kDa protein 16-like [Dorcoceras hygrometricum]
MVLRLDEQLRVAILAACDWIVATGWLRLDSLRLDSLRLVVASGSCDCFVCLVDCGYMSASREFSTVQDDRIACNWWKWKSNCYACVASGSRCARERMTNRRTEEPVARGMVLRLDKAAAGSDTREFQVTKLDRVEVQLVDPRIPESQFIYDMY